MHTLIRILLTALMITSSAALGLAGETKDHICFRVLDTNGDGVVTLSEFEAHYGQSAEKFKAADADQNGELTHDEYHVSLGHGSSS